MSKPMRFADILNRFLGGATERLTLARTLEALAAQERIREAVPTLCVNCGEGVVQGKCDCPPVRSLCVHDWAVTSNSDEMRCCKCGIAQRDASVRSPAPAGPTLGRSPESTLFTLAEQIAYMRGEVAELGGEHAPGLKPLMALNILATLEAEQQKREDGK